MKHFNNIDWHVTDRCNLRCVSCGHMCPLVDHKDISIDKTIEDAEKDFSILYEKTNNGEYIDNITLTGGECTLNKNLSDIQLIQEFFPKEQWKYIEEQNSIFCELKIGLIERIFSIYNKDQYVPYNTCTSIFITI